MENLKIDLKQIMFNQEKKEIVVSKLKSMGFEVGFQSIDFYTYLYACVDTKFGNIIQFGNNSKTFYLNKGREVTVMEVLNGKVK